MRYKDKPVKVDRFTQKTTYAKENPPCTIETKGLTSRGIHIPSGAFEQICELIRKQTRLSIEELIGVGGTGTVFIAKHSDLPLRRAVKIIHYGDRNDKQEFLDTLKRSLTVVTQMHHPGLIRVHDWIATDEYAYIVMDLHNPDRNFRSFPAFHAVRKKPRVILDALERIIEVLAYCHSIPADLPIRGSRGVFVHGDLKAENVLVDYQGQPVVTDWLIPNLGPAGQSFPYNDTRAYGTPMYMPPEQSSDGTVTPASDVWNLGVLAFEAVTGFYPFEREDDIYQGYPMSVHRFAPFIPAWLDTLIKSCLLPDHRQRPNDGNALLNAWRRASLRAAPRRSDSLPGRAAHQTVFLSSTFRDLKAERIAVQHALRRLALVKCISMEERGAYAESPRDVCLTEVEMADLMVLILGNSYGSVDRVSGLSMTSMEYEHAMNCGIPVLAYLKRWSTSILSPGNEMDAELQEFVEALDGVTYSSFAGPDDLAIQVVCDVARLVNAA